jgi:RNA polymerase sigma factor (sigma-70 family)
VPPEISAEQTVPLSPPAPDWERTLVAAARNGDETAFRELYKTFRDPVWALIMAIIGDVNQAQDVMQTVFFKAFRGLGGFRFESGLFTWIHRIARNECRNHLRRRRAHLLPLESILGSRDEIDRSPGSIRPDESLGELRAAVRRLPVKMREVVVLKYVEGLSYKEMSRVLGCPSGTVASRLNRALSELGSSLRRPGSGRRDGAGDEEMRA